MQVSGKKVVIAAGVIGLATFLTVLISFRKIGWDRFQANTKLMEGKRNVVVMAKALIICADNSQHLPESSKPIPPELADVAGGKVIESTPEAWSDPVWTCAKYSQTGEQRFRYQWIRKSETDGTIRAEADFDGNGSAEAVYEQDISCGVHAGDFRCEPGELHDLAQLR
jgi:hypothetical protein